MTLPAKYSRPPNFSVSRSPEAVVLRLDGSNQYFDEFEDIARRLELKPDHLAEGRFSVWSDGVRTIASMWPLMKAGVREEFRVGMLQVLAQATEKTVSNRLLSVFELDPAAPISDPQETWIRSFHGGMLALVAVSRQIPAHLRGAAMAQLEEVFQTSALGVNSRSGPFRDGARRTLQKMIPAMVGITGVTGKAYEAWEYWLLAQETVSSQGDLQEAHLLAIRAFLSSGRNLAMEGEPIDVVGRLVSEIDWGPRGLTL